MATPRGLRNNNPLNIRESSDNFVGELTPNTDGAFKQFVDIAHGYRAAFVILANYVKNGYNTISKIINRWAPPGDNNNTSSYINNVAARSGVGRDTLLTLNDGDKLVKIVAAMSQSENGVAAVMSDVNKGFKLQQTIKKKVVTNSSLLA